MRITPISVQLNEQPKIQKKYITNNNTTITTPDYAPVNNVNMLAYLTNFTGGYSVNLSETIKNLDKLATKHSDVYPKNVREWAGMILESGNTGKETLIDIHKKLYENIKSCFSLSELKAKFPEFKDVKSANEVDAREGSLLDDLRKGKFEDFNTEEDLSLQIIKLYWGEGFSLNDLKKYTGGHDLNPIMNKLGIPKVNKHYGHILKFSDVEYNERLTKQMALKRLEAQDIKAQQQNGEPVYIKRGPLSAEHKKHISEGLQKYYEEHPERLFEMSERQKKYYEDNPDQAKMMHRVMVKAWYAPGVDRIRNALSKFMKMNNFKDFSNSELLTPETLSKQKSDLLKRFWGQNEWAKKTFSNSVAFAWKKVKEEQTVVYKVDVTPDLFKRRFLMWCEKEGIDTANLDFDKFKYCPSDSSKNEFNATEINKYTPRFIDSCVGDESQKLANTYMFSLLKFGKHLKSLENQDINPDSKATAFLLRRVIHSLLFKPAIGNNPPMPRSFDASEIQEVYYTILTTLMDKHEPKMLMQLNKFLNESYNYLDKKWKAGESLRLTPDISNF